ncbi:MAG TPA: hypothetical protein PLH37_01180 [bacterium]|nr:hypothetical protein [bacterium]
MTAKKYSRAVLVVAQVFGYATMGFIAKAVIYSLHTLLSGWCLFLYLFLKNHQLKINSF